MSKNPFCSTDQVRRTWSYIDGLARRAWDRDGLTRDQKTAVHSAAGKFYSELLSATSNLNLEEITRQAPPRGLNVDDENWSQFAKDELIDMIDWEDICSVTDAFLKTTSLLRVLQGGSNAGHRHFLFRGQRNISWNLLPRKGRALIKAGWKPPDQVLNDQGRTRVLAEELKSLDEFRKKWEGLEEVEDIDRSKRLNDEHPEWWFRMQHYDHGDGTRLLDITTSLTSALLFACVDWSSGILDDSTDGVLYLWEEGSNGNVDDYLLHKIPPTAEDLFSQYPDAP